jgi:hypothetical protein
MQGAGGAVARCACVKEWIVNRNLCDGSTKMGAHRGDLNLRGMGRQAWARAMLDVLQRRGRSYGLLTVYEESRLNSLRQP